MLSLSELKGKYKFAAMKTKSSAFEGMRESTEQISEPAQTFGAKKSAAIYKPSSSINNIMNYDEGPKTKVSFLKSKFDIA